jgi:hypothetical protein
MSRVCRVQGLLSCPRFVCIGFVLFRDDCPVQCLSVQGLSCPGFVLSRVCPVQGLSVKGLSCPEFVLSRVCPVQGWLSCPPGFVLSKVSPVKGYSCPGSVLYRVCSVQSLFCPRFVFPGFVLSKVGLSGVVCVSPLYKYFKSTTHSFAYMPYHSPPLSKPLNISQFRFKYLVTINIRTKKACERTSVHSLFVYHSPHPEY